MTTDKSLQFLYFQCIDSLSFQCEIEVLEYYNTENNKIDPNTIYIVAVSEVCSVIINIK